MSLLRIKELEAQLARRDARIAELERDSARLDFLDKYAIVAKPGQPVRSTIDDEMRRKMQ